MNTGGGQIQLDPYSYAHVYTYANIQSITIHAHVPRFIGPVGFHTVLVQREHLVAYRVMQWKANRMYMQRCANIFWEYNACTKRIGRFPQKETPGNEARQCECTIILPLLHALNPHTHAHTQARARTVQKYTFEFPARLAPPIYPV